MTYSYVGNIPLQEYRPHSYIIAMINDSNSIKQIRDYLKDSLEKAGHKVTEVPSEGDLALKIPGLGKTLVIHWKSQINNALLLSLASKASNSDEYVIVVATSRLTKAMFERFLGKGFSVIDTYGNGCIDFPGFWYERFVANEYNRRVPVSGTPFSKKASRIVRAFLSEPARKWSQTDLCEATGITQGYVSKCLKMLLNEDYIGVLGDAIRLKEPDRLLDDWIPRYRFDRHIQSRYAFSYPNYKDGLDKLGKNLANAGIRYAYTGWSGAYLRAAYAIPPSIMAYVNRTPEKPEDIGLYPVEHSENCILIEPQDVGVLQFSRYVNGLGVVCDPQLYLDLYRMPGRALDQADVIRKKLLNWESIVNE